MTTDNYYKGINHVLHISTNVSKGCEYCEFPIGGDKFPESINHYITDHGYKLLHIGIETSRDMSGNLWHSSVALLGK